MGPLSSSSRALSVTEANAPPKVHGPPGHCPPCPPLGGPEYAYKQIFSNPSAVVILHTYDPFFNQGTERLEIDFKRSLSTKKNDRIT